MRIPLVYIVNHFLRAFYSWSTITCIRILTIRKIFHVFFVAHLINIARILELHGVPVRITSPILPILNDSIQRNFPITVFINLFLMLLRLFGGERITNLMDRMNLDEDTPIENKMLSKSIENAQTSVESRNFQSRKATLEYDDVMNKQREIIYGQRKQVLDGMDVKGIIMGMMESAIGHQVRSAFMGQEHLDMVQCKELLRGLEGVYFTKYTVKIDESQLPTLTEDDFIEMFTKAAADFYEKKEQEITPPVMRELERVVLLRVVDEYWMDHIDAMQELRQGIRLRAYAQVNPIDAYKKESLEMFEEMISAIQDETVRRIFSARIKSEAEVKRERVADGIVASTSGDGTVKKQPRKVQKIGRNDPCPCGSGKKYKQCCGR